MDDCFQQPVDYSVVPVVGLDNGFGVLTRLSVGSFSPPSDSSDICFSRVVLSDSVFFPPVMRLWGQGGAEGCWCALMVSLREAVDACGT